MILNGPSYYQYQYKLLRRPAGLDEEFGLDVVLAFFTTKVRRGGPRIFLQLTTCVALLLLALKVLACGYVDYSIWPWHAAEIESDGSVVGGLRIVAFGGQDVATPDYMPGPEFVGMDMRSWTELLCDELDCSSYSSFVPFEAPNRTIASTLLYAASLDRALNETVRSRGPGLDYSYMSDTYPVEWDMPDLEDQITSFLSMPKPQNTPTETLWVISLGMWDIWSLASEPLDVSRPAVDAVVSHILAQVERLYQGALNESSIAWSNSSQILAGPTKVSLIETKGDKYARADKEVSAKKNAKNTGNNTAHATTEHFRILLPRLFDPSLTPGWKRTRPQAPAIHSEAEQLRNAAMLTEYWNRQLNRFVSSWVRTAEHKSKLAKGSTKVPHQGQPDKKLDQFQPGEGTAAVKPQTTPVPDPVPQPQRDAFIYKLDEYLVDLIVDREFRNAGIVDGNGVGTKPTQEGFMDVRQPCMEEPTDDEDEEEEEEESPRQPAVRGRTAVLREDSLPSNTTSKYRLCEAPQEHLFFSPFTVSQRAIATIGRQAADMVRRNDSVRAHRAKSHLASYRQPYGA